MTNKILRIILIIFEGFLALTTIAGGIGLVSGYLNPGLDLLKGSPFHNYIIPGLSLGILVGGFSLAATILLIRRHPLAVYACGASGIGIIIFEIVEVLAIGSDPGIARTLQAFYFCWGIAISLLSAWLWAANKGTVR